MFSDRPPVTTATYSGTKVCVSSFSITAVVAGEYALGFTTAVFPAAIASIYGSNVKRKG